MTEQEKQHWRAYWTLHGFRLELGNLPWISNRARVKKLLAWSMLVPGGLPTLRLALGQIDNRLYGRLRRYARSYLRKGLKGPWMTSSGALKLGSPLKLTPGIPFRVQLSFSDVSQSSVEVHLHGKNP